MGDWTHDPPNGRQTLYRLGHKDLMSTRSLVLYDMIRCAPSVAVACSVTWFLVLNLVAGHFDCHKNLMSARSLVLYTWFGNSRTLMSFSYSVVFNCFWSKNFLSMGSNTGKSDVTILQHMHICYAIVYVAELSLSRGSKVSGRTVGSQRQLNTDSIHSLYLRYTNCLR